MLTGCTNKTSPVPRRADPAECRRRQHRRTQPILHQETPRPQPDIRGCIRPRLTAPQPPLVLPRGTRLEVRLNQTIDVKHAASGDRFTGSLAEPVVEGNTVAVPCRFRRDAVKFCWPTGGECSKESR